MTDNILNDNYCIDCKHYSFKGRCFEKYETNYVDKTKLYYHATTVRYNFIKNIHCCEMFSEKPDGIFKRLCKTFRNIIK